MKPMLFLSLAAVLVCAPALAQTGAAAADAVATIITNSIEAQKQVDEGRAVRVSVSALRLLGKETEIVALLRTGQGEVPKTGDNDILDFDEDGLKVIVSLVRDYRGDGVVVLEATGSVFDPSCVLEVGNECFKALSSYPAREQVLLRPGINKIRVGDYRLTVDVEGKLNSI